MSDAHAMPGPGLGRPTFAMTRTKGDVVLGVLLLVAAVVLFAHVAIATAVSVLFIGWSTLISGVVAIGFSLASIGKQGFWTALLGGGLLFVLGLVMVRNPGVAAVTLTLVAGTAFLASGIARLAAAVQDEEGRVALIIGGGVSTLLGLIVIFNLFTATLTLLGVLVAVEVMAEGISLLVAGRLRSVEPGHA